MGEYFIRRPHFAIALALAMTILGAVSLTRLAIELYPNITPPVVQVTASYTGADARTVNDAVATPLGEQVMGTGDMLYMQTTSADDGSMTMQLTFDIGSSPDMDAIFTQNNVSAATPQLPSAVASQGVVTRKSETGFLMVYALSSDGRYDDEFLSNYAYINLEDRLAKVEGVGNVEIMGAGEYAMRIWLSPERLHYYSLSLDEVVSAISTQSKIYPTGKFGSEPMPSPVPYTYTVTLPPAINSAEEFSEIILLIDAEGNEVRLSDVAEVELGAKAYNIRSTFGDNPSTLIVVYQESGSNAVEVGARVQEVMDEQVQRMPDGVELHTVVDATQSIKAGVEDIVRTLLIALVLVVAIIYLFLQDWRATLIPLVAIPVSLVGVFVLFPLLNFSLNVISLLGLVLAIGLVVDDAIVVIEAVQAGLERGEGAEEATRKAMERVSSPIIATTVVLLAVFIPVSFTAGITGRLFQQFAITIASAVTLSAVNALTLSPALCAMLLRPHREVESGFFRRFNLWFDRRLERYGSAVATVAKHTTRTGIFVLLSLAIIAALWRVLPSGFLPDEDQGYLMVFVSTPEASALGTTIEAMQHVEKVVSKHEAVEFTSLAAGYNMIAGVASSSSGVIFVVLKPFNERRTSAMELASVLNEELYSAVPEAECYAFIPPSIPGLGLTSGVTFEVQDLEGRGTEYLWQQTQRLMDTLRQNPAIAQVSTQFSASTPQRRININKAHALSEGVSLDEVYSSLSTYLGGDYIGNFNRFGRLYQTYIQAVPSSRLNARSLDNYFVRNGSGESVPLSAFVSVSDTVGVEYLQQFNLYESISLNVTPSARSSTGDVMKIIERTASASLPDDVAMAWSGVSYQQANSSKGGAAVYLLALVFVFLALVALYNSWSLPAAILMSVPVAIVGALAATALLHLFDATFVNNVYVQISLVMLIALAAKNAILVVEYADRIHHSSPSKSILSSAIEASRERVRPIIMTAAAFILGVMPLVFATGSYSTSRHTMGVALVGGMVAATAAGIFLYPAAYYLVASIMEKKQQNKEK